VVFFTYFYTDVIFQQQNMAENLRKQGASIPGIRPGKRTEDYLNQKVRRITLLGLSSSVSSPFCPGWWVCSWVSFRNDGFGVHGGRGYAHLLNRVAHRRRRGAGYDAATGSPVADASLRQVPAQGHPGLRLVAG